MIAADPVGSLNSHQKIERGKSQTANEVLAGSRQAMNTMLLADNFDSATLPVDSRSHGGQGASMPCLMATMRGTGQTRGSLRSSRLK